MDPQSIAKMLVQSEAPAHPETDDAGDDGLDEGLEVAADEMMSAMKAGDVQSFALALKSFLRMC